MNSVRHFKPLFKLFKPQRLIFERMEVDTERIFADAAKYKETGSAGDRVERLLAPLKETGSLTHARQVVGLTNELLDEISDNQTSGERARLRELGRLNDPGMQVIAGEMAGRLMALKGNPKAQLAALREVLEVSGVPDSLPMVDRIGLGLAMDGIFGLGIEKIPGMDRAAMAIALWQIRQRVGNFVLIRHGDEPGDLIHDLEASSEKTGIGYEVNRVVEAAKSTKEAEDNLDWYTIRVREGARALAIKPTALVALSTSAVSTESSQEALVTALESIFKEVSQRNPECVITIDSERSDLLDMTTGAVLKAQKKYPSVRVRQAMQAYQEDTESGVLNPFLMASRRRVMAGGVPLGGRLVCGANQMGEEQFASVMGWDRTPLVGSRVEAHANYQRFLRLVTDPIMRGYFELTVGSMNVLTQMDAILMFAEAGLYSSKFSEAVVHAMLNGMTGQETFRILKKRYGIRGQEYIPTIDDEWLYESLKFYGRRVDEVGGAKNWLNAKARDEAERRRNGGRGGRRERNHFLKTQVEEGYMPARLHFDTHGDPAREGKGLERAILPTRGTHERPLEIPETLQDWRMMPNPNFGAREDREWSDGLIEACRGRTDREAPHIHLPSYIRPHEREELPGTQVILRGRTRPDLLLGIAEYATHADIDCIATRLREDRSGWSALPMEARLAKLAESTRNVQRRRDRLIIAEMLDIHKALPEADGEVNEAIDFGTLAQVHYRELMKRENIDFTMDKERSLGLVICPKNFPVAIVKGHIDYLLARGYRVMVKPSTGEGEEAILSTWELIQTYRDAGIGEDVLAFVPCDNETASHLVRQADEIRFTGSPGVAEIIHKTNPEAVLFAETGGANWVIVDETMDPEDAALLIVNANSGFAGQKCSAPRLVVLTEKVDRKAIQRHLVRIQKTMLVGSPLTRWVDVTPLSKEHAPGTPFYEKVMNCTPGEEWLLRPQAMGHPGIRVVTDLEAFQPENIDEIFASVFTVVQIQGGVEEAVAYVNRLKGCITGGVYTDDQAKLAHAAKHAKAGNLYLGRRAITGALAHQAFGDGPGIAHRGVHGVKTGSLEMVAMTGEYRRKPRTYAEYDKERITPDEEGLYQVLTRLGEIWGRAGSNPATEEICDAVEAGWSYLYEMQQYFSRQRRAPQRIFGQDDWVESRPIGHVVLRVNPHDSNRDILSKVFATVAAGNRLTISMPREMEYDWSVVESLLGNELRRVEFQIENDQAFAERLASNPERPEAERIGCVLYARRESIPGGAYRAAAQGALFIDARTPTGDGLIDMVSQSRTATYCHVFHNAGDTRYHEMREAKGLGLIRNPFIAETHGS